MHGESLAGCIAGTAGPSFHALPPPKSTGETCFTSIGLRSILALARAGRLQATLLEFSAQAIAVAILAHCPAADESTMRWWRSTISRYAGDWRPSHLANRTHRRPGIAADWVEAAAFAWLATERAILCRAIYQTFWCQGTKNTRGDLPRLMQKGLTPPFCTVGNHALLYRNEEPQPQVVVAFGFLITNCEPCRLSCSRFQRGLKLIGSISNFTLVSRSRYRRHDHFVEGNPYWKLNNRRRDVRELRSAHPLLDQCDVCACR